MILSRLRSTTEIPLSDAERRRLLRGKARLPGAEPRRCRAFPHEREKPAP